MKQAPQAAADRPSLENLVESGLVELESLHPGGLALTSEFASLCNIAAGTSVLDVACGTGETACYLAESFAAQVCGLDHSSDLLERARAKSAARDLKVDFRQGDAAALPFPDAEFDVAICECTLCLLDKNAVLQEMARVVRPGGYVAIHDLFWEGNAPDKLKEALVENEGEEPETLQGWRQLFTGAGLINIRVVDKSDVKARWMRDNRKQLGISGQLRLGMYVLRRWWFSGLWAILRSERIFSSTHLGYCIVVSEKP